MKHKTLLLKDFISQLGQRATPLQQTQTWRYCPQLFALLLFPCFLQKEARKNIHGTVLIYKKSQRVLLVFKPKIKQQRSNKKKSKTKSQCAPPFLQGRERGRASNQIFKKGSLTKVQLLEGDFWERGGDFFQGRGGGNVLIKNKLKSEIFNDKKTL